jgi:chromosome segregation ATPase
MKSKDRLHQIEIDLNDCQEQLAVWEERCLNAEKKNTQYEQQLQQLTQQLEDDGLNTVRKFKAFEDRVKELQLQLLQKSQELENAQEVARKLRREYQSTRQDAEGMLQVMSGLERQLAEYSNRESEIERLAGESKEKLEEAYVARDQVRVLLLLCCSLTLWYRQAITREEQLKRDVERLQEDRKKAALQKQVSLPSFPPRPSPSLPLACLSSPSIAARY